MPDRRAQRDTHALNDDGMVLCNPRDREAAHRADVGDIAVGEAETVTCKRCLALQPKHGSRPHTAAFLIVTDRSLDEVKAALFSEEARLSTEEVELSVVDGGYRLDVHPAPGRPKTDAEWEWLLGSIRAAMGRVLEGSRIETIPPRAR